jgi:hypothetical protein
MVYKKRRISTLLDHLELVMMVMMAGTMDQILLLGLRAKYYLASSSTTNSFVG